MRPATASVTRTEWKTGGSGDAEEGVAGDGFPFAANGRGDAEDVVLELCLSDVEPVAGCKVFDSAVTNTTAAAVSVPPMDAFENLDLGDSVAEVLVDSKELGAAAEAQECRDTEVFVADSDEVQRIISFRDEDKGASSKALSAVKGELSSGFSETIDIPDWLLQVRGEDQKLSALLTSWAPPVVQKATSSFVRHRGRYTFRCRVRVQTFLRRCGLMFVTAAWVFSGCVVFWLLFADTPPPEICALGQLSDGSDFQRSASWERVIRTHAIASGMQALVVGPVSVFLFAGRQQHHLVFFVFFAFYEGLHVMVTYTSILFTCETLLILYLSSVTIMIIFQFMTSSLAVRSIDVLELSLLQNVGASSLRRSIWCLALIHLSLKLSDAPGAGLSKYDHGQMFLNIWIAMYWTFIFGLVGNAAFAIRIIFRIRNLVRSAARASGVAGDADAVRAWKVCNEQILGMAIGPLFMPFRHLAWAAGDGLWPLPDIDSTHLDVHLLLIMIPNIAGSVLAVVGALILSGFFSGAFSPGRGVRAAEQVEKRVSATLAYKPCEDRGWHKKVKELANRAITLEKILNFYEGLGVEYMPSFDPERSSTNDVVRRAIIPLTRPYGCSLSSVLMQGVPTRPNALVSHNWANRFRDLIASIVADAIQDDTYEWAAQMLDQDFSTLREMLRKAGQLQRTYWVCSFCISQHHGICGALGPTDRDTASGEPHLPCKCDKPKFLNNTPPCRQDGRSIPCEMNKFSDMMGFLAATDPHFHHVIAVDREFKVFSRAWVLAEVATAFWAGLEQHMKLGSLMSLQVHAESLKNLRIEDMQASRPEDVIEILAQIPDIGKFNEQMQYLIFEGLVAKWKAFDLDCKLRVAGRFVRLIRCHGCSRGPK